MVMTSNIVSDIGVGFEPDPEENVFDILMGEYERVIFKSVITSFGLDGLIKDQHGGDVDTVFNVRNGVAYKNAANAEAYQNRGMYNSSLYHKDEIYKDIKAVAKEKFLITGENVEDQYTGGQLGFYGKSKNAPHGKNAELDHVIAAKAIHEDPGRILSGQNGVDLANSPENLKFTNKSLNASMQADDIPDYIEKHTELPEKQKNKMMEHYKNAKKSYERKIATYYTNPKFWKDTGIAAAKVGAGMALRQALGFIMTEVWFTVKDKLANAAHSVEDKLNAIAEGIKQGFMNAREKYSELLSQLGEGAVAGVLSSLMTTLCNIFFTTAKNVARIVRQTFASIVEAAKILIFNPDKYSFSERMKAALKILATGASVVIGTVVQETVNKTLMAHISAMPSLEPIVDIVSVFCGSICTGFLTVTLLYFIDNDPFHGFLTKTIDKTIVEYKSQARLFAEYAATLEKLDISKFEQEAELYYDLSLKLENTTDQNSLNKLLIQAAERLDIPSPWGDCSLDDFMKDSSAILFFGV